MTIDSNLLATGREIRSAWREEEEAFIEESSHYSRKQLNLLDYLSSVAHAGHDVCVNTPYGVVTGPLAHLGEDYFTVATNNKSTDLTSYSAKSFTKSLIEIDILDKQDHSWKTALYRLDKSFTSLIDEIAKAEKVVEIETAQGNVHIGKIQMLSDSIVIYPKNENAMEKTMVVEGTTVISLDSIVSVNYQI